MPSAPSARVLIGSMDPNAEHHHRDQVCENLEQRLNSSDEHQRRELDIIVGDTGFELVP